MCTEPPQDEQTLLISVLLLITFMYHLSRLTVLTCDSTWVSSFFFLSIFFFIFSKVVYLQCCLIAIWNCCHLGMFCVDHTTMHHHFMQIHIHGACMFSGNWPPALLAEWPGSFMCYCCNTGVEQIPEWESAQNADPGVENSPAAPARTQTWDLWVTSLPLLTPLPIISSVFQIIKHHMKVKTWCRSGQMFLLKMMHNYVETETNYTDGGQG